jgi:hypothetical protein
MSDYTRGRADGCRTAAELARRCEPDLRPLVARVRRCGREYTRGYVDGLAAWLHIRRAA